MSGQDAGPGGAPQPRLCPACGGRRVTDKTRHTHDIDPGTGTLTQRVEHHTSACERCGGSGTWA
ncbi:DnaJ-class molecular chaperone [Kitasatospora gansuensis]|uniref:DnaJ-class molecular chaperone n=1 Tax=Kitasatospora gansuensis TaxID=258050 RepID=A0A7W7SK81_9ACTN|nr:hypothetical protein [Kitasatospora gansuensis]MBB4944475.1 DnaJ-class molecular chaperone [Kitasatospora gansuensis]MBB4951856.1 DnaJ-class molecular chaperone [Kitasatospora gansuensis]MBB4951872.1 DnaJ-class molecular chaperone [Kitasatospora gansuensis]